MRNKVFLGGTCGNSNWRKQLEEVLEVDSFNPVVEDWTKECIAEEQRQKEICNIHLYVITREMKGVYSIAEAVQSSNIKNKITILHIIPGGFDEGQLRSLKAVCGLVKENKGLAYVNSDLGATSNLLNVCFGK